MLIERKPTHKEIILAHMKEHGTITKAEAWDLYRFGDTTQRIKDLRADGWLIVSESPRIKGKNYAVYRLLSDEKITEGGPDNDTFK